MEEELLNKILDGINDIKADVKDLSKRMGNIEKRMDSMEKRMDHMEGRQDEIYHMLRSWEEERTLTRSQLDKLSVDAEKMKHHTHKVEIDTTKVVI